MFIKPIAKLSFLALVAITGAFVTNTNATAQDEAQLLQDGDTSSAATGTHLTFHLSSDMRDANRSYLMLGSISGEGATVVGNLTIPLVFDVYTAFTLSNPNGGFIQNQFGNLGADAQAEASIMVPPVSSDLIGLEVRHCFVVLNEANWITTVSNAVTFTVTE